MRLMLIALLISGLAYAQGKDAKGGGVGQRKAVDLDGNDSQEGEGGDDEGGGPPEGSMTAQPPGGKSSPGTTHTVEKGDTLWDLSQKYLGSPWYWPKVWSYNPEIGNPHWIYPGNVVRFFGEIEGVPSQVELGTAPDVSSSDLIDEDTVQVAGKIGMVPKDTLLFRAAGFVTKKEIEEAGHIAGAFMQAEMLSENVPVYLVFKNKGTVKMGDKLVIFRPGDEVEHPESGDTVGYLTLPMGVAQVTRTDGPMVTAMITDSFQEMRRGDLVAPYSEAMLKRVAQKPNDKKLDGTIVAQLGIGTYVTMIIDRGSDQGVQPGNTFTVIRQQDGIEKDTGNFPAIRDERYPEEEVGHCVAWEVKSSATSCVLMNAIREIVVGDWVQMRVGSPGARASLR